MGDVIPFPAPKPACSDDDEWVRRALSLHGLDPDTMTAADLAALTEYDYELMAVRMRLYYGVRPLSDEGA